MIVDSYLGAGSADASGAAAGRAALGRGAAEERHKCVPNRNEHKALRELPSTRWRHNPQVLSTHKRQQIVTTSWYHNGHCAGEKPDFIIDEVGRYCQLLLAGDTKAVETLFLREVKGLHLNARTGLYDPQSLRHENQPERRDPVTRPWVVAPLVEFAELEALRTGLLTAALVANYLGDAGGRQGLQRLVHLAVGETVI